MFGKSERDVADLLAMGVSKELVDNLSAVEVNDLLKSLLYLKGKYHMAVSSSA